MIGASEAAAGLIIATVITIVAFITIPLPRHKPEQPVPVVAPVPSPPPEEEPKQALPPKEATLNFIVKQDVKAEKLEDLEDRLTLIQVRLNKLEQKANVMEKKR